MKSIFYVEAVIIQSYPPPFLGLLIRINPLLSLFDGLDSHNLSKYFAVLR